MTNLDQAARDCAERCVKTLNLNNTPVPYVPTLAVDVLTPIILAAMRGVRPENACPDCGRTDDHTHPANIDVPLRRRFKQVYNEHDNAVLAEQIDGTLDTIAIPQTGRLGTAARNANGRLLADAPALLAGNAALREQLEAVTKERDEAVRDLADAETEHEQRMQGYDEQIKHGINNEATITTLTTTNARLRGALERILEAATGERQVADDDTGGLAWVAETAKAALADAGPDPVAGVRPVDERTIELLKCRTNQAQQIARLRNALERIKAEVEDDVDGAPDAGPANKRANYICSVADEALDRSGPDPVSIAHAPADLEEWLCNLCGTNSAQTAKEAIGVALKERDDLRAECERLRDELKTHQELVTAQNANLLTAGQHLDEALRLMGPLCHTDSASIPDATGVLINAEWGLRSTSITLGDLRAIAAFVARHGQKGGQ